MRGIEPLSVPESVTIAATFLFESPSAAVARKYLMGRRHRKAPKHDYWHPSA